VEGNLERALSEEPRPGAERKLTGKEEALLVATACAIMGNYLGLRYFAYRDRGQDDRNGRKRELGLFLFFSAVGLVIENSVLYATTYGLGWDSPIATNVSKFFGIGVATLFRFWSYRTWVFKTAGHQPEPNAPHPEPVLNLSWEKS